MQGWDVIKNDGDMTYVTYEEAEQLCQCPVAGVFIFLEGNTPRYSRFHFFVLLHQIRWNRDANRPQLSESITDRLPGLCAIHRQFAPANTLLITHGDFLNALLPSLPDIPDLGRFVPEESAFAVVQGFHDQRITDETCILKLHRVNSMM